MSFDNVINVHTNLLAALSGGPGACLCSPGWCGSPPEVCPLYLLSITCHIYFLIKLLKSNLKKGRSFREPPSQPPVQRLMMFQCCWNVQATTVHKQYYQTQTHLRINKRNLNSLTRRVHMWILLAAHALLCWIPLQTKTEGSCHLLNHPCPTFKGDKFTLPEEIHSDTLG